MAISKLVKSGQSFDRPSVSAFFGKAAPANDNLQKKSDMFSSDGNFVTSITNMLQELNNQLQKLQETSKNTILAFNKIIKDIRDVKKDIVSKFRIVNNELSSNKLDFVNAIRGGELPKPIEIPELGAPVPANAPAVAANTSSGFGIDDLFKALEALGLGKDILKGLGKFASALIDIAPTLLRFFTASGIAAPLLAILGVGLGINEIRKANDALHKKLGITDDTPQEEIKKKKTAYFAERKEAPQRDMAQIRMLAEEVMDGKHDAELGIKPQDNAKQSDQIRQKVAEDLLLPVPKIDPRLSNSIPRLPTRAERKGEEEPPSSKDTGAPAAASNTTSPPAPAANAGGSGSASPSPAANAGSSDSAPSAPAANAGGGGAPTPAPAPAPPSTGTGGAGSIQVPGAGTPAPVTPTATKPEAPAAPPTGAPSPVSNPAPTTAPEGTPTPVTVSTPAVPNTIVKGEAPIYTAMGDVATPGTPDQSFVGSGRGSVREEAGARALAQEVGSGRGSGEAELAQRRKDAAPNQTTAAAPTATPAVDPHAKSKALFQEVLDIEKQGGNSTAKYFEADKQRQAELAAIKDTPAPGTPAKATTPKAATPKAKAEPDTRAFGRGGGDHTDTRFFGRGGGEHVAPSSLRTDTDAAAVEARVGAEHAQNITATAEANAKRDEEENARQAKLRAMDIDEAYTDRGKPEQAQLEKTLSTKEAIEAAPTDEAAREISLSDMGSRFRGRAVPPPAPNLVPPPKNAGGADNQPTVINNNQTQNSETSSGGAGNNVAGQNLPMKATNDWLKDFIERQQIAYQ